MSRLASRLRKLGIEAGAGSPVSTGPMPMPMPTASGAADPRTALRQLLGLRQRVDAPPRRAGAPVDRRIEGAEIAPGLHLAECRGNWPSPASDADADANHAAGIDPATLLFFDTETTGLAGGTGTRAFMIGAGDWIGGQFRIRQLTISTLAAEPAMLDAFSSWLSGTPTLVSYNGRCYDAPLLATRYRLARRVNPLSGLPHIDLLHPTRRRFRGRWENCRLATIERNALGIVREDDLPGAEAPLAWRRFLAGGSAVDLRRVGLHNAQDLRSLAALWHCLSRAEKAAQDEAATALRPASLAR